MTIINNLISSKVISNLDTYQYTVGAAAMHVVNLAISEVPISGITITIKQNSNTVASTSAPGAAQSLVQLITTMNCAAGDVIQVIVASSTPSDSVPNSFKGTLLIKQGSIN